jgi:CheY-like chemotaxis protein
MGGKLVVESELGQGATFGFTLPSRIVPDRQRDYLKKQIPILRGKTALLVDDNDTNLQIVTLQCQHWGLKTVSVFSGKAALSVLNEQNRVVDLAILDMSMPEMDGLTLAQNIRLIPKFAKLPLMLLSSVDQMDCDLAKTVFNATVTKPIKQSQLYDQLIEIFTAVDLTMPDELGNIEQKTVEVAKLKVLLADDDEINQIVGENMLNQLGCQVDIVGDGTEVIVQLQKHRYDLILMDLHMPNMSGIETSRYIRDNIPAHQQPIIVAMTADVMGEVMADCEEAGMQGYLSKPVTLEALKAAIQNIQPKSFENPESQVNEEADITVDPKVLAQYKPEMQSKLLMAFQQQIAKSLAEIRTSIEQHQAELLESSAHRLKGSAAAIGAVAIAGICGDLQSRGKENLMQDVETQLAALEQVCEKTLQILDLG